MPLFLVYVPIILLSLKGAGLWLHAGSALFLAFMARSAGVFSLEFLSCAISGILFAYVFAWAYGRKRPLFTVALLAVSVQVVFMTICDWIPPYREAYADLIRLTSAFAEKTLGLPKAAPGLERIQWEFLLPLSEILKALLVTWILALVFHRPAGRGRPVLTEFKVPEWFQWVFAAGLALAITGLGGRIGFYLFASGLFLYLLNGISVVRAFAVKTRMSRLNEALLYLLQPGFLFLPLFLLGLLETWVGFRGRIEAIGAGSSGNHSDHINP